MAEKRLTLRRRRWTLVFSLPFTVLMLVICIYSVFLMFTGDRLVTFIAGLSAFGTFCVGGTLGKAVVQALYDLQPAVIIDSHGLNDVRGGNGLVPWQEIERVTLDLDEQRILVDMADHAVPERRRRVSKTRRLLSGGDYTVALAGLSYHPQELGRALAWHHRQSGNRRGVHGGSESDPTAAIAG
ncbi:STM3941 family protein [Paracidovorax valerianellae]|uniref:Uncharacterized protein n=1 Tax=Paracidovorax valerianellae TaxID=187868 RepID=A0A1G6R3J1_9BURK|nr:STM3941 family protein [Paracidovorax valerianellae]MDA8445137.1 hypothetical protein [Paracidovorax valerianellae]SDC98587.1 hypothetical protein SAMN05192589_10415 [Paracidovorax valerianellae]